MTDQTGNKLVAPLTIRSNIQISTSFTQIPHQTYENQTESKISHSS
jgi:hypothetical protein